MSTVKPSKTFEQQIEILKNRGLIINDYKEAVFMLSNVNYYRFTAYLLPYKKEDGTYKDGITFEMIASLYRFDKEFRTLLIDILGSIEISFRTYVAYTLANNHKPLGYLRKENFINPTYHNNFLLSLENEKRSNSNKLFIKHHNEKYNGKLPIWVATEIMTFGMLSKLYSNMLPEDKTFIKNNLCNVPIALVEQWLQALTNIRNQCAHYGRIYNTKLPIVKIKKQDKKHNIPDNMIFAYIIAMKYLIADSITWNKFFTKLQVLISDYYNYIDLKLIGFPENWIELLVKK